jgi:hypothetical protein
MSREGLAAVNNGDDRPAPTRCASIAAVASTRKRPKSGAVPPDRSRPHVGPYGYEGKLPGGATHSDQSRN